MVTFGRLLPGSEKRELVAGPFRAAKAAMVEADLLGVEAKTLRCELEPPADGPGVGPGALHAPAPGRVILATVARRPDQGKDARGAVGHLLQQPFAEDVADLEGKPQEDVPRLLYAHR